LEVEAELVHRGQPGPHGPTNFERFVAKRMGATTYEVDASHVPMLSKPSFVLDVIRTAANSVNRSAPRSAIAPPVSVLRRIAGGN
jgi:hypothetical protein